MDFDYQGRPCYWSSHHQIPAKQIKKVIEHPNLENTVIVAEVASIYSGDPKTGKTSSGQLLYKFDEEFRDFEGETSQQTTSQVRLSFRDLSIDYMSKSSLSQVYDFKILPSFGHHLTKEPLELELQVSDDRKLLQFTLFRKIAVFIDLETMRELHREEVEEGMLFYNVSVPRRDLACLLSIKDKFNQKFRVFNLEKKEILFENKIENTMNMFIEKCEVFLNKAFLRPEQEDKIFFIAFNRTLLQKQKKKQYRMAQLDLREQKFDLVKDFEFTDVDRVHNYVKDAHFFTRNGEQHMLLFSSQQNLLINLKTLEIKKFNKSFFFGSGRLLFFHYNKDFIYYEDPQTQSFHKLDVLSDQVEDFDSELGQKVTQQRKGLTFLQFNESEQKIYGLLKDENSKMYGQQFVWRSLTEEKQGICFSCNYGKREILTEWSIAVFAHSSWFNKIYIYNVLRGYTAYFDIPEDQEFISFTQHFDTAKIEDRKVILRYLSVDQEGTTTVRDLELNPSAEEEDNEFIRGLDQLADDKFTDFKIPNDLVNISLKRANDENKFDIFMQTQNDIIVYDFQEGKHQFACKDENIAPVESIRLSQMYFPQVYVKYEGAHSVIKAIQKNTKRPETILVDEFSQIQSISLIRKPDMTFVFCTIDKKFKIKVREIKFYTQIQNNFELYQISPWAQDLLSRRKFEPCFQGLIPNFSSMDIAVSGFQFRLYKDQDEAQKGGELEKFLLKEKYQNLIEKPTFYNTQDNRYNQSTYFANICLDKQESQVVSVQRHLNQRKTMGYFMAEEVFQTYQVQNSTLQYVLTRHKTQMQVWDPFFILQSSFNIQSLVKEYKGENWSILRSSLSSNSRFFACLIEMSKIKEIRILLFQRTAESMQQIKLNCDELPLKKTDQFIVGNEGQIHIFEGRKFKALVDQSGYKTQVQSSLLQGWLEDQYDLVQINNNQRKDFLQDFMQLISEKALNQRTIELNSILEIEEVIPLDAENNAKILGIVGKCSNSRKFMLWDIKEGFELSNFSITKSETIIQSYKNLFIFDTQKGTIRNGRTGVLREGLTLEKLAKSTTYIASFGRLAFQHEGSHVTFVMPHSPANNIFLEKVNQNKLQTISRELLNFREPMLNQSLIKIIGLNQTKLKSLKKVIDLSAEEEGEEIKRFYSQILDQPMKEKAFTTKKSFSTSFVKNIKENDQLSAMQEAVLMSKPVLDIYLSMLTEIEPEYNLNAQVITSSEDFKIMLGCPSFPQYLDSCIRKLPEDQNIYGPWKHEGEKAAFLRPFSLVDDKFVSEEILDPEMEFQQNVGFRALEIAFIHQQDGVKEFSSILAEVKDDKFLGLQVTEILINVVWDKIYPRLMAWIFFPYLAFFLLFTVFTSLLYDSDYITTFCFLAPCVLYSILQLIFEAKQIKDQGLKYFYSVAAIWNMLDVMSSFFVLAFSAIELLELKVEKYHTITAALAVFFLWLKLFYFLRLFKPTSSFIRMIIEMLSDIKIFLLIFFTGILAFSNTYFILDTGSHQPNASFIHSFLYVYLMNLGEFDFEYYDQTEFGPYYWAIFLMSTMFIMIILLNLLIAIMGDTFDRVMEVAKESQLKQICQFIDEYAFLLPEHQFTKNTSILIAQIENSIQNDNKDWEGKIGALKTQFQKSLGLVNEKMGKLQNQFHSEMDKQGKVVSEVKTNFTEIQARLEANSQEITNLKADLGERFDQVLSAIKGE